MLSTFSRTVPSSVYEAWILLCFFVSCIMLHFSFFLSLHNAVRPRGHSRHVALSSNPSMLIDKSKR